MRNYCVGENWSLDLDGLARFHLLEYENMGLKYYFSAYTCIYVGRTVHLASAWTIKQSLFIFRI
jgi:hypothetical protein